MKTALSITRSENFAEWYQAVVREADMAESSPARGCMVIKPWGYGVWELIQRGWTAGSRTPATRTVISRCSSP